MERKMLEVVLASGPFSAGRRRLDARPRPSAGARVAGALRLPAIGRPTCLRRSAAFGAYYNAARPEGGGYWQSRTQIAFIFSCLSAKKANETC